MVKDFLVIANPSDPTASVPVYSAPPPVGALVISVYPQNARTVVSVAFPFELQKQNWVKILVGTGKLQNAYIEVSHLQALDPKPTAGKVVRALLYFEDGSVEELKANPASSVTISDTGPNNTRS